MIAGAPYPLSWSIRTRHKHAKVPFVSHQRLSLRCIHPNMHLCPHYHLTVRGGQVLYVYPAGPQAGLPWTPAREDAVTPVMLQAGQAAFWPSQSPTRSVNGEGLNVSVVFTFETPQSKLADVLRRALGQPSPAACAQTDLEPRFDVGARGLVWRDGMAPDWAPTPKKATRRRAPAAKALKAA